MAFQNFKNTLFQFLMAAGVATPQAPANGAAVTDQQLICDAQGALWVRLSAGAGTYVKANPVADGIVLNGGDAVSVATYGWVFNPVSLKYDRIVAIADNVDGQQGGNTGLQGVVARLSGWNGGTYERVRVANVFRTVGPITAAGSTAVWTPAAGKRFRLMGYQLEVAGNSSIAAAGLDAVNLLDGAAVVLRHNPWVPAAAGTVLGAVVLNDSDLGQGYLSAAANNVLSVNIATAFATGGVTVNVWGTEE